jgi:hypothetical protein
MSRWSSRFALLSGHSDTVDTLDTVEAAPRRVSRQSTVSPCHGEIEAPLTLHTVNSVNSVPVSQGEVETAERDAIVREAELATKQTISNTVMVPGLIRTSRWPR